MMAFRFLALLLLLTLAGCASPPSPEMGTKPIAASDPTYMQRYHLASTTVAAVPGAEGQNVEKLQFATPPNATAILVEVAWNDTVQQVDAFLHSEAARCTEHGSGPMTQAGSAVQCQTDRKLGFPTDGEFRWGDGDDLRTASPSRLYVNQTESDGGGVNGGLSQIFERCPNPCHWQAYPTWYAPRAGLHWDIFVTVFYGPVPDGYTAIPWLQK